MLELNINGEDIPLRISKFPAGESLLRIEDNNEVYFGVSKREANHIIITMNFEGNDDIINLMLLVDAARRLYKSSNPVIALYMPYLPYARQDRVCNSGESLSVKVIADIINSLKFHVVTCLDIHSDVGAALINDLVHLDIMLSGIKLVRMFNQENTVLVSPDAGANKKVSKLAKGFGYDSIVFADKVRELSSGLITSFSVHSTEHIGNRDFLIVDDIGDGCGTFIGLAKELRKLTDGKIYLFVTHGIFSKGAEVFDGIIDKVFTANLIGKEHPLIEVI